MSHFVETVAVQTVIGLMVLLLIIPLCRSDPLVSIYFVVTSTFHGVEFLQINQNPKSIQMNMIREENYPVEKHTVHTKDGYILSVHRIPRMDIKPEKRKVILLLHGMWPIQMEFSFFLYLWMLSKFVCTSGVFELTSVSLCC